jgi:hypothetical protein
VDVSLNWTHRGTGRSGQAPWFSSSTRRPIPYTLFFKRGLCDEGSAGTACGSRSRPRNWFNYWRDDGAVEALTEPKVVYHVTSRGLTEYVAPQLPCLPPPNVLVDHIIVTDLAIDMLEDMAVAEIPGQCQAFTADGGVGIHGVEKAIRHELEHRDIWHRKHDPQGSWLPLPDSDAQGCYYDFIPDEKEPANGTSPNMVDSCDLADHPVGDPDYANYGDNEVAGRRAQNGPWGDSNKDYANPGMRAGLQNAGLGIRDELIARGGALTALSTLLEPVIRQRGNSRMLQRINQTGPAWLTGEYSSWVVDDDADGLHNRLSLSVKLQVAEEGRYWLTSDLSAADGSLIATSDSAA